MTAVRTKIESIDEALIVASQARVLARAAELSYSDPGAALRVIADELPDHSMDFGIDLLRVAVVEQIGRHMLAAKGTEFDVHRHFWANLDRYLPGAMRIKSQSNPHHMPDGWIQLDGVAMPVEIKRDAFNGAAARQLARYMNEYGATRGVAVAKEINCPRDPRVIYIEYDAAAV